jgi:hypothetical protein
VIGDPIGDHEQSDERVQAVGARGILRLNPPDFPLTRRSQHRKHEAPDPLFRSQGVTT